MTDPLVFISDIRSLNLCARGIRRWFTEHGFDFADFLENGIRASRLEATQDAFALRVVATVKEREHGREK